MEVYFLFPLESFFRHVGTRRKLSMSTSPGVLSMSVDEKSPLCKSGNRDSGKVAALTKMSVLF